MNGDGTADFQIQLYGNIALQAGDFVFQPAFYCAGTRILTERGEVAIEHLAIGDRVPTASGDTRAIKWIGQRRLDCSRHPDPRAVWPVRVRSGAFGDALPHRDLWLSPDHAVFVDDVLIPIRQLINGTLIDQVRRDRVTYYHVELAQHSVLFAEGLPAESYRDTGNRGMFAGRGTAIDLHPELDVAKTRSERAAAPLAIDEARVRPVWERLAVRARALGQPIRRPALTEDPMLRLQLDASTIRPVVCEPNHCIFMLPEHRGPVRLLSRSGYPTDGQPWADDRRRLGVNISRVVWHDREGPHDMPVDHPNLAEGWWAVEHDGDRLRRWTRGSALLPLPPEATMVEFHVSGGMDYRLDPTVQGIPGTAVPRRGLAQG